MHPRELANQILAHGLWKTSGLTPERTIDARIAVDIKEHGTASRFQRVSKGIYALRVWGLQEYVGKPFKKKEHSQPNALRGKKIQPIQLTVQPTPAEKM